MKIDLKLLALATAALFAACDDDDDDNVQDSLPSVQNTHLGHEYIDLGLKSGALWAKEDFSMPFNGEDCYYFSWAEIAPKELYGAPTYKYCNKADSTFTKYCFDPVIGGGVFVDSIGQLQSKDDIAQMNWNGSWFVPSKKDWEELYESCDWEYGKDASGNINFTGKSKINGNVITFASRGAKQGGKILYAGKGAFYWSSDLHENNSCGYGISFSPSKTEMKDGKRFIGHCVRAVIPGAIAKNQAVDLGLPSGLKWANANIGAASPEKAGSLFAWGECVEKDVYDFTNYKHCKGTPKTLIKYCTMADFGTPDGKTKLEPEDDAALQLWGDNWRIPTAQEVQELMDNCTWNFKIVNGQKGFQVIGTNGNSIFIPMAGTQWLEKMEYYNQRGFYWTSDIDDSGDMYAKGLFINPKSFSFGKQYNRASGRTIRPVCK